MEASSYDLLKVKQILQKYELCDYCLGRQFNLLSKVRDDELGKFLKETLKIETKGCYICSSLMSKIEDFGLKVIDYIKDYEFDSFLVGVSLRAEYTEREDELRAEFKLRGGESIKSSIGKLLGLKISKLSKRVNFKDPQLRILVFPESELIKVKTKSIFLFGRYRKHIRGISQKIRRCYSCKGKGCLYCNFKGVKDSITKILENRISPLFKADKVKFSWFGGEDENSLVLGKGRPFYAEIINPTLRKVNLETLIFKDAIEIKELKYVEGLYKGNFKVKFRAEVNFIPEPKKEQIEEVESFFKDRTIKVITGKGEREKKVYRINLKKVRDIYKVLGYIDGGIHIKNFLMGKEGLEPNLAEKLKCNVILNPSKPFDILDVDLT
ncbi:MAG: tRNA pseudouridine(54/55) synthase Pus10 [Nitrososphaerales archaeon]